MKTPISLRTLFFTLTFSVLLIFSRIIYTETIAYLFLVWNLILAVIPFGISYWLSQKKDAKMGLRKLMAFAICILFLPNSPYILTDLFHLRFQHSSSIWFDTLLIFSAAWSGLLLFFHTLKNLEAAFSLHSRSGIIQLFFLAVIVFACGFGIYLGRYERFNSWELLTNPFPLFEEILDRFVNPFSHRRTWGMTISYGVFLLVAYFGFQGFRTFPRNILPSKSE